MKKSTLLLLLTCIGLFAFSQDWKGVAVPANPGSGKQWQLQSNVSDDFNYTFNSTSKAATFGNKWTNFYHNSWDGPGPTKWRRDHCAVSGGVLNVWASRAAGEMKSFKVDCNLDGVEETWNLPATRAGCITSTRRVQYPVFVEARVKIANAVMASDVWLLSPDDTQEIDILEAYGGKAARNDWLARRLHLSHHVFIRNPFQDYQPKDNSTWYTRGDVAYWTDAWHRIGVYWASPTRLEYYVDGRLVKVMDKLNTANGKDGIDPYGFTGGRGLHKAMDIIINVEDQNWNACKGRTPTDAEIKNFNNHNFKVDWIRVYKPVSSSNNSGNTGGSSGGNTGGSSGGNTGGSSITVQAESFTKTGGTFNDASAGGPGLGVKKAGSIINYVNKGDYVEYKISIPETGAYEIVYYISSPVTGSTINFGMGTTVWNSTTVPNNGSWNSFKALKASRTANFTKGTHIIRLSAGGKNWTWNLDKFTMTRVSAMKSATNDMETGISLNENELQVYPNPATGFVTVTVNSNYRDQVELKVYNSQGISVIEELIPTQVEYMMDIDHLPKGLYFIQTDKSVNKLVIE